MSRLQDAVASHFASPASRFTLCLAIGAAAAGTYGLMKSGTSPFKSDKPRILPSPQETTLPHLSTEEQSNLPYPPSAIPGARDVDSPYGRIRVYEFGPEEGSKVLLIHGISTPCIALREIACNLAERGCRVMLFDLFGRGYTSAPNPTIYPYDSPLYTSQIHLVLSSSPLPWKRFALLGYSLGGALAADYTSYFPSQISHLILLAPGGLIRPHHISWKSKLLYQIPFIPAWMTEALVARRLYTGPEVVARSIEPEAVVDEGKVGRGKVVQAVYASSHQRLLPGNANSSVGKIVDWQIEHHGGFVPAFISSIQYAPIHGQHARWRRIGEYMTRRVEGEMEGGLKEVLLVLGETDPIIVAEEVVEDVRSVLGEEFVRVEVMKGVGHDIAIERAGEIAGLVGELLGL